MVVDDFDMRRSSFIPNETDTPLIIDPDRMLSLPVCLQRFEAVARWNTQIRQDPGLIQQTEFPQRHVLNIGRQSPTSPAGPRSEEHTSELQSQFHLVCRLLLEKKKNKKKI